MSIYAGGWPGNTPAASAKRCQTSRSIGIRGATMREKNTGMRAVLTRLLGIATVACALVASPAVAEAATTTDIPRDAILAQRSDTGLQYPYSVKLEAGKDYVSGGEITLGH